jgi:hypothetical protein
LQLFIEGWGNLFHAAVTQGKHQSFSSKNLLSTSYATSLTLIKQLLTGIYTFGDCAQMAGEKVAPNSQRMNE